MNIQIIIKKVTLGIIIFSIFSGCAMDEFARKYSPEAVEQRMKDSFSGKSKNNFLKDFQEPKLAKLFEKFYDMPRHSLKYNKTTFTVTNQWVHFSENIYMNKSDTYIEDHSNSNEFSELYKKAVKERGNEYKVLTSSFNKKLIERLYGQSLPTIDRERMLLIKWNKIPMVAEFNEENELISVLLFKVEVGAAFNKLNNPNVQSEIILHGIVAVGSSLNSIKNKTPKKEWVDNEI